MRPVEGEPALSALRMARNPRRRSPGLIHHSDRATQYSSGEYRAALATHAMVANKSKKGDGYDNAVAETCFATLEFEFLMQNN
jgi:putative transposase